MGQGCRVGPWLRSCLGIWHPIANRHCTRDWKTRSAPVGKKTERCLRTNLHLPHHIRENLSRRGRALLPTKSKDREGRDCAQNKNYQKAAQHIQSSCTMVMCSPPVLSNNSRTPFSVNRGSRASIARKNPSLLTRINRSQLNIG